MSGAPPPPTSGLLPGQSAPLATITATDHRGLVGIATALALIFSLISLVIRAYVRYQFSNSFGKDDVIIVVAFIFSIFQSATVFAEVGKGFGHALKDIAPNDLPGLQKASYASDLLFILTIYLTKCSVVFLFLRLSPDRKHRTASMFILGLSTLLTIVSVFMIAITCNVSQPWVFIQPRCTASWPRWEAFAAFDIFTECLLGVMPLLIVQSLQMSWNKKYIVLMAFCLRLLILVPIAFRLYYLKQEYFSPDPTLTGTWAAICTQVDMAFAVVSATIPCLRPFMTATATIPPPTDGTRKDSRYAKGSKEKSGRHGGNSYGLRSLTGRLRGGRGGAGGAGNGNSQNDDKQLSSSTQEIFGNNGDHTVSVMSPGDQHSVESQESRQMIIRRDVEWAVTDEDHTTTSTTPPPHRSYSHHGHERSRSDELGPGHAI